MVFCSWDHFSSKELIDFTPNCLQSYNADIEGQKKVKKIKVPKFRFIFVKFVKSVCG